MDLSREFYEIYAKHLDEAELAEINRRFIVDVSNLGPSAVAITKSETANELFDRVMDYPVIKESLKYGGENKYDSLDHFGFCFGRAMLVHLEALRMKIPKENIMKFWFIGPFKNGHWNHHVITAIRVEGQGWVLLDPVFGKVMSLPEYYEHTLKFFGEKLAIVATKPKRFLSAHSLLTNSNYTKENLQKDFSVMKIYWKEFFDDLMSQFRNR
jgi:hypothetical protein